MTRIVINPTSLRATARTLRDAGHESQSVGRALGREPIPAMPSFMRARTAATLRNAEREATLVADELFRDAHGLDVRAERIERDDDRRSPFAGAIRGLRWFRDRALENRALRYGFKAWSGWHAYRTLFGRYRKGHSILSKFRVVKSALQKIKGTFGRRWPKLGAGLRIAGKVVRGPLGMLFGYDAMQRGLHDLYSEDPYRHAGAASLEKSADRVQTAAGFFGFAAGAFATAALVATATGFGAPVGLLLGSVAAGLTLTSLTLETTRFLLDHTAEQWENDADAWQEDADRLGFRAPSPATARR